MFAVRSRSTASANRRLFDASNQTMKRSRAAALAFVGFACALAASACGADNSGPRADVKIQPVAEAVPVAGPVLHGNYVVWGTGSVEGSEPIEPIRIFGARPAGSPQLLYELPLARNRPESLSGLEPIPLGRDPRPDDEGLPCHPTREVDDGSRGRRRWLADPGRGVGADGAALAGAARTPARLSQPACARPGGDERDPARAADGDAVERALGDGDLLLLVGLPALPRVGRGGGLSRVLAAGAARLRRSDRDRMGVAGAGRRARKGAPGWRRDRSQSH